MKKFIPEVMALESKIALNGAIYGAVTEITPQAYAAAMGYPDYSGSSYALVDNPPPLTSAPAPPIQIKLFGPGVGDSSNTPPPSVVIPPFVGPPAPDDSGSSDGFPDDPFTYPAPSPDNSGSSDYPGDYPPFMPLPPIPVGPSGPAL